MSAENILDRLWGHYYVVGNIVYYQDGCWRFLTSVALCLSIPDTEDTLQVQKKCVVIT